tara:strand:+ start:168 stop:350 length:183 start_codon:yes stop_codon:yes gene_type:complete
VKEFKNKSEHAKNQMGSENYEAVSEELKKDEKKLGVSLALFYYHSIQFYLISYLIFSFIN